MVEEVVEERTTPSASALPLLFLQVFHQPAFDHMLELTVQAPEVMASRLLATLQQILHTILLAQSPAPQRRENRMSSGHTLARGQSPAMRSKCCSAQTRSLEGLANTSGFTTEISLPRDTFFKFNLPVSILYFFVLP